jgi:DNA-directed RNA polymerase specialized sigma subunit
MDVRRYLERIGMINILISTKVEEYNRWEEIASGLGGFSGAEKTGGGGSNDKIPNAVCHYCDIEREIDSLIAERNAILNNIEKLPADEYKVIYLLYVNRLSLKEAAYKCNKSYEWVKLRRDKAFALLETIVTPKNT